MRKRCMLVGMLVGCATPGDGLNPVDEGTERTMESGWGRGTPDPVSDALFDVTRVHTVRITLPTASKEALLLEPREWAPGAIEIAGERFEDVGVRLKGNNSFRPIDEKPSLKIDLAEFVEGQRLGNMKKLTFNNMIEDPTSAREILSYWLWNEAGMMAPRAAYARVYVNDEDYGLYLLLEPMDKAFLERRFANPDGDLWEGNNGADFTADGVEFYESKTGEGDRERLAAIAEALAEPTDDYWRVADRHFQMEQVVDFWAWSNVIATLDGYPYTLNDYFVYADPLAGGRLMMSPWGLDESWNPAFFFQWGQGVALYSCAADAKCLARVEAAIEGALDRYEELDVPAQLEALFALSAAEVASDPRSPWPAETVAQERIELLQLTEHWPAQLREQIAAP